MGIVLMSVLVFSTLSSSNGLASDAVLTLSTKGEEMAYDKKILMVKPGQNVKLTFKNAGSMQHNVVVVKPGKATEVARASIAAGAAKDWVASSSPSVIAFTKMVDPNQSVTIEFTAPMDPGDYPYVCTFPGHDTTMRGVLKVK